MKMLIQKRLEGTSLSTKVEHTQKVRKEWQQLELTVTFRKTDALIEKGSSYDVRLWIMCIRKRLLLCIRTIVFSFYFILNWSASSSSSRLLLHSLKFGKLRNARVCSFLYESWNSWSVEFKIWIC
jgi:hypothetical protein